MIRDGVWCHECETVTLDVDLAYDTVWTDWVVCAECGELEPGLWKIRGRVHTGQTIPTGSQQLVDMRVEDDVEEDADW